MVILGLKYEDFVQQKRVLPQVVDAFPDLKNKEFAKEHNYVDNLQWVFMNDSLFQICFPEGFSVQSYEKRKEGELCQMKIFHFIITNQDGLKKYITSLSFKELLLSEKRGAFIVPKSICVVASKPIFSLQKQLLTLIFRKVILPNNSASIQAHQQHPANYISYMNEMTEELIKKNPDAYLMQRIEFCATIFFNHLYYCEDVEKDIEIEEIRERSTPQAYPEGKRKNHRQKKKIIESYFRFRNTKTYGFTLENYSFELLLQSLKPERILFLITALLLERKIILIKENFGDIALIMESLVSLLNPLQWNFVFITYLTPKLVECLEAPFPYIIGVSQKVWQDHCVLREYPDDIIILDIDNQKLLNQVREELPPLPQPQASVLQRSLKNLLDIKERFIETIQENANQRIPKEKIDEFYWAYAQLRVKQSFFNFFLLTVNNYIGYFKNLDEEGDLSPHKKDRQKEEGDLNLKEENNIDLFNRSDLLEKLLLQEVEGNSTHQLSILNRINFDIITDMPGIQYELMGQYEQLKSQRSDQSQERRTQNRTQIQGLSMNGLDFQQRSIYKKEQQLSDNKSRNNNKIGQSRSGDMNQAQMHKSHAAHKRSGAGIIYNNYLSMADSKNAILLSQEDDILTPTGKNPDSANLTQDYDVMRRIKKGDTAVGTINKNANNSIAEMIQMQTNQGNLKNRVHSENSFIKNFGSFSLNKTVIVSSNQHLSKNNNQPQISKQKTQINKVSQQLNSTYSNVFLEKLQPLNQTITSSPKILSNGQKNIYNQGAQTSTNRGLNNTSGLALEKRKSGPDQCINKFSQQMALKETLNRKIMQERNKHGLHLKSTDDRISVQKQPNPSSKLQSNLFSNNISQFSNADDTLQKSPQIPSSKIVPKTNIDLMNPRNKKMSRNEERKLAKKRGFLGFEQHDSFYQFYSPKEELNKLAIMQMIQRKMEYKKMVEGKSGQTLDNKEQISFTNYLNQNYLSNGSDDEQLTRILAQQPLGASSVHNKIQFQKRSINDPAQAALLIHQISDPLATTINFQNNFIQQKPHIQQSPSVGTEMSSIRKGDRIDRLNDRSGLQDIISNDQLDDDGFVIIQPSTETQVIPLQKHQSPIIKNKMITKLQQSPSPQQPIRMNTMQNSGRAKIESKRNIAKIKSNEFSNSKPYVNINRGAGVTTTMNEEDIENLNESRPLKFPADDTINSTVNQVSQKHPKLVDQESPQVNSSLKQQNLSFKHFINNLKDKKDSLPQISSTKKYNQISSVNKSPTNNMSKLNKVSTISNQPKSKLSQQQTFDNTSRTDPSKPQATLMRKRSSPAFNQERSPTNQSNQSNMMGKNTKGTKLFFDNTKTQPNSGNSIQQQNQAHFKQRPVNNQNSKQNKSGIQSSSTRLQIDLEKKAKLTNISSKIAIEKEIASLRISPIPNIDEILKQQKQNHTQNPNSSSGTSEDQINYLSNMDNNRSSNLLFNQSNSNNTRHIINSNFASRISEKSLNRHNEMMYQSMSNIVEGEIFESSNLTMFGSQTVRNQNTGRSNHSSNHQCVNTKIKNQLAANILHTQSKRSSSNLQNEFMSRASQLSAQLSQRPSQVSLMADFKKQEKEIDQFIMEQKARSSSKSDVLSQNEGINNISLSILRQSPRLMHNNNSKTATNASTHLRQPIASKNFMFSGPGQAQNSLLTSQDTKEMNIILNAIKGQIPGTTTNNQGSVQTVKIDLKRGNNYVVSPKGLGTKQKTVDDQHQKSKHQTLRKSSIEEVKNQNLLSSDSKAQSSAKLRDNKNSYQTTVQKKQAKSPQPSSNMMSSNLYLKALQSQEFQLKEKGKMPKGFTQSTDPMVSLLKESNYNSNAQKQQNSLINKAQKIQNSSNKNLKLDLNDRNQKNHQFNTLIKSSSHIEGSQLSKSTKNLYGIINKERLLDEINGVNDALYKIQETKKKTQKSGFNILEDTLSYQTNSIGSYQTSPRMIKSSSLQQHTQARGLKNNLSNVFKTANQQRNQEELDQQQQTERINQYPQKLKKYPVQEKPHAQIERNHQIQQDTEHYDDVVIDFPRQIQNEEGQKQNLDRNSKLFMEIDEMMNEDPLQRRSKGFNTQKSKQSAISDSFTYKSMAVSGERSGKNNQLQPYGQPLLEIRQNQNDHRSSVTSQKNQVHFNSQQATFDKKNQIFKQLQKQITMQSENSLLQNHNYQSSRHSHTAAVSQDKLPHELGNIVLKQQKKRQLRHGLTTCFVFPTKDSNNYVKRDLNQDVFCKINSHLGDVDNDPHTPKSNASFRSTDKRTSRKKRQRFQSEVQNIADDEEGDFIQTLDLKDNFIYLQRDQQPRKGPYRFHSASVDDKNNEPRFQHEPVRPPFLPKQEIDIRHEEIKQNLQDDGDFDLPSDDCNEDDDEFLPNEQQSNIQNPQQTMLKYEILFEDADLKDTDDKFTSRDVNFNRLKNQLHS